MLCWIVLALVVLAALAVLPDVAGDAAVLSGAGVGGVGGAG